MLAGYSFRPRVWPWLLALCACAATIALGNWQTRRAEEKRALAANQQRISVVGEFLPQHTVLLDNKLHQGRAGYEVVTPLRMAEGINVLVKRGWIEASPRREQVPEVRTPRGRLRVEGAVLSHLPQPMKLDEPARGRVRQRLDIRAFAAETGLALQTFVIEQHSSVDDGLVRDWSPPDTGVDMHKAYALQWYSFAALSIVLALVFSFVRK